MAEHEEFSEPIYKAHCLMVPIPAQGHITPVLQFAKYLIPRKIRVTLALTRFISKTANISSSSAAGGGIHLETISDGFDEHGLAVTDDGQVYFDTFERVGSQTLADLVRKQSDAGHPVNCILYDPHIPWCLDVSKRFGLIGAAFFTQSCAVDAVFYHVHRGLLKPPVTEVEETVSIPGLPPFEPHDLPSFVHDGSYPAFLAALVGQFSNIQNADWVLCNSVHELEPKAADWLSKNLPNFKTIGPTLPSFYLDKQLPDDKDYGLSFFKPDNEACSNWLQSKPKRSVVYVSFGSIADLGPEHVEELCWGLKNSNHYFLWVVRSSEEAKLPLMFKAETAEKGLIVSWCSQLEVLASGAVGCFLTHCGWNSTLEAMSLGVPMVAMPRWTDQTTNAKFISDVWKTGVKAKKDEKKGVVGRDEIERCVKEVMEEGEETRRNCDKFAKLCKDAVGECGSSCRSITLFADSLILASRTHP
uniref:Glycosyltransferase n=1 Tax=Linum usitatissimum TaxID=4006 RepID=I2BH57_LINUS|nr:UDP-glycosyltransferase 1 [Linum usitatissimum]